MLFRSAAYARAGIEVSDAVSHVMDETKWRSMFLVTKAVFPLLKLLRLLDSHVPTMPIIFNACLRVEEALALSKDELYEHFDEGYDVDEAGYVHTQIVAAYEKYAPELKHYWALAGFVLNPNLIDEANDFEDQALLLSAVKKVVRKVFCNDPDMDKRMNEVLEALNEFRRKAHPFDETHIWSSNLMAVGSIHLWHQTHSFPERRTFGKFAMIVTSQLTTMGAAERNWGHIKSVWDDAKARLSTDKVEKKIYVYEGSRRERDAKLCSDDEKLISAVWTEEDMNFDLGLEKRGVEIGRASCRERV